MALVDLPIYLDGHEILTRLLIGAVVLTNLMLAWEIVRHGFIGRGERVGYTVLTAFCFSVSYLGVFWGLCSMVYTFRS
jgi:hypothetical protein